MNGVRYVIFVFVLMLMPFNSLAQSSKAVETSTDILMFIPSAAGGIVSLLERDYEGLLQHVESGAVTVAATYLLKYTIKKRRPNGEDYHSFPSNHAGIAFVGAGFLQQRYGWKLGIPAYAVAAYVGWGRVYSKCHDVWDVLAGAAIGVTSSLVFTTPFAKEHNVVIAPAVMSESGVGFYFSMNL